MIFQELAEFLVWLGLTIGVIWSVLICLVGIAVALWRMNQEEKSEEKDDGRIG